MNRITVEYDLSLAMVEGKIRDKLIEMGWTPPSFEEPKKVELEGGNWKFFMDGDILENDYSSKLSKHSLRQTKESAQLAAKRMLRVNRLSALAAQLGGEKEWIKSEYNWTIAFINDNKMWKPVAGNLIESPCNVYMTKECAEQICDLLNKGLFDLNGGE